METYKKSKLLSPINLNLAAELQDKEFRHLSYLMRTCNSIAIQIRELREKRGLSQSQLAALCGTHRVTIMRLENNSDSAIRNFRYLVDIAKALDVKIEINLIPIEEEDE